MGSYPSGLEFLRGIAEGMVPPPSMLQTLPMRLVRVDSGRVEFEARPDEQHLNPRGMVHGGFAATALDSCTGCAVQTQLEAGSSCSTIELNVKMMRPVQAGMVLRAIGTTLNLSRRLGVAEGRLVDEAGKLYAHATATFMIQRD